MLEYFKTYFHVVFVKRLRPSTFIKRTRDYDDDDVNNIDDNDDVFVCLYLMFL